MSLKPSGNDLSCSAATLGTAKSPTRTHSDHEAYGKVEEESGAFTGSF